jgi:hypothetical protein
MRCLYRSHFIALGIIGFFVVDLVWPSLLQLIMLPQPSQGRYGKSPEVHYRTESRVCPIESPIHRSTPNLATMERGDEFGDCDQTKGIDHQRCSAATSLPARRRPIGPFLRHCERAEIRIAQAQRLDARDTSDLPYIEPPAAQGMERVDDFSRSQRLVGPECSSMGVCRQSGIG